MRHLFLLTMLCAPALALISAHAATVRIDVRDVDGKPLQGAVVQVQTARPTAPSARGLYVVAQKDIQFQPRVLIVPVGATVGFPNRDKVRHHVYSFSPAKRFELKLYGQQDTRTVTFDRPGVIALGCNIHDAMTGFILVVDTPYAAQTDANGRVVFDIPPGAVTLTLWHPSVRGKNNMLSQPGTVSAQGLATTLALRR